jgi:inner membrane protein involved in colicin E2 resistance
MQSTFQRTITSKPFVVGFIALLLLIPLSMIESKVKERSFFRGTVIADVSESWASNQTLMGPVVVLVFVMVLASELYRSMDIHPIQYLMVGVGVSVFYLLLLALSEHIDFILAYAIATLMCSSLLTYYGVQIFRTIKGGIAFGFVIASLYALLLVILLSADIALLLGSIIIFFAVMLLMMTTRNAERLRLWLPGQQDP